MPPLNVKSAGLSKGGITMEEPDQGERLRGLEERILILKKAETRPASPQTQVAKGLSQANTALQMIVELVTGLLIGFGIGIGLDWLFGTRPLFLVLFILLGFGAGVNVMLRTARDISEKSEAEQKRPAYNEGK